MVSKSYSGSFRNTTDFVFVYYALGEHVTVDNDIAKCSLCEIASLKKVPGVIPEKFDIIIVGEAPGRDEAEQGFPFVGKAGAELDAKLRLHKLRAARLNILKCRPYDKTDPKQGNRKPTPEEVKACCPFLEKQLKTARELNPKAVIVPLGMTASEYFLGSDFVRGHFTDGHDYAMIYPILHPAAILHNPGRRKDWDSEWGGLEITLKNISVKAEPFVHLHVHTEFSYLDSANRTDLLCKSAADKGFRALACTDHYNAHGLVIFYDECRKAGIKPILGIELSFAWTLEEEPGHIILLCENLTGYKNLLKIIHKSEDLNQVGKPAKRASVTWDILKEHKEGLFIATACIGGFFSKLATQNELLWMDRIPEIQRTFGDKFHLEVQTTHLHWDLNRLWATYCRTYGLPLLATNDVHYINKEDFKFHCLIKGIAQPWNRNPGFEDDCFWLKTSPEMLEDLPPDISEIIAAGMQRAESVAEMCNVALPRGENHLPKPHIEGDHNEFFISEIKRRIPERFPDGLTPEYQARLSLELSRYIKLNFVDYMLIIYELLEWSRSEGIYCGTRGSVAGSLVSYILGISELDPIKFKLIFDRFISEVRIDYPDVDMDFDSRHREKVIQHLRDIYGSDHVSHILVAQRAKGKMAIQDVCRVNRVPIDVAKRLSDLVVTRTSGDARDSFTIKEMFEEFDFSKRFAVENPGIVEQAVKYEALVRQCTTHAAGILVSDAPLDEYVPLEYKMLEGGAALHSGYDHRSAETLGLLKLDVLGLAALAIISSTEHAVREKIPDFDISRIPLDDEKTLNMFKLGLTRGIFQLESRGMQALCKQLKPRNFDTLCDLVALYRPGPLNSGRTAAYAKRYNDPNAWSKDTPEEKALYPWTGDSLNCCIYQEQVMMILHDFGNFTWEHSDIARKMISKKYGEAAMNKSREAFIEGAVANGNTRELANKVFDKIILFGSYAFNKAHAASYALLAYRMMYLKAHFTPEFMVSALRESHKDIKLLIAEARALGTVIEYPDINVSFVDFASISGTIFAGLTSINGVGAESAKTIIIERIRNGPFTSIKDLQTRVGKKHANARVIKAMAKAEAFRSMGISHHDAVYQSELLTKKAAQLAESHPYSNIEAYEVRSQVLDIPPAVHPANLYDNVLKTIPRKFSKIGDLEHGNKGIVNIPTLLVKIDFKTEGAEFRWAEDKTVTQRKWCVLDLEDETGTVQMILRPEQYEKYKKELEISQGKVIIAVGISGRRSRLEGLSVYNILSIREDPNHEIRSKLPNFKNLRKKNEALSILSALEKPEGQTFPLLAQIISIRQWYSKKGNLITTLYLVDDTGFAEMYVWKNDWEFICESVQVGETMVLNSRKLGMDRFNLCVESDEDFG